MATAVCELHNLEEEVSMLIFSRVDNRVTELLEAGNIQGARDYLKCSKKGLSKKDIEVLSSAIDEFAKERLLADAD